MKSLSPNRIPGTIRDGYTNGTDNVDLHYTSYGTGFPIILCNGLGCSRHYFRYIRDYFAGSLQVILWDYRGHGDSGSPPDYQNLRMSDLARDALAVMDALGIDSAVAGGHSMGSQVILEMYRENPSRIDGMIPILGPYEHPFNTLFDSELPSYLFPLIRQIGLSAPDFFGNLVKTFYRMNLTPKLIKILALNPNRTSLDVLENYFDHLETVDFELFLRLADEMQNHSADDLLDEIDVPTLIVSGDKDFLTPRSIGEEMAERIPGAELLVLQDGTHVGLIEYPEVVTLRIEKFLRDHYQVEVPKVDILE